MHDRFRGGKRIEASLSIRAGSPNMGTPNMGTPMKMSPKMIMKPNAVINNDTAKNMRPVSIGPN